MGALATATPNTTGVTTPPVVQNYATAPNLGVTAGSAPGAGSLTQGTALPNITTTQQQATAVPQFYADYLNQLATQGAVAAQNSQYVGAQPLQEQAFNQVGSNVGNYQPALTNATNLASSVGGTSLADAIGNYGQANIAANLAPQATSGLVGSGQFGSSRGASALGQVLSNANLGILQQQQAALQQDQANKLNAANTLGNLATTTQNLGLGDVNALSTLGAQQQTIKQNAQNFPMAQLTAESGLLRGATVPTSTSSTYTGPIPGAYNTSPLSQIAGLGTLAAGVGSLVPAVGNLISKLPSINLGGSGSPPNTVPAGSTADPSGSGNWVGPNGQVYKPDGTPIDTSGSVSSGGNDATNSYIDPNTGQVSTDPNQTGSMYDPNSYGAG